MIEVDNLVGKNLIKKYNTKLAEIVPLFIRMSEKQQLKVLQKAQSVFDRRKKKRTSCLIPAYYYIHGNPYRSFILDINESGAFIEVNEEFPIGQTVKLEYLDPFYRYPAKFITEIVWSRSCAIGVKFLQSYRMLH